MDFSTKAFNYYVPSIVHVTVQEGLACLSEAEADDYYKILFMESGIMHIQLNGRVFILTGANVIFLNEKDEIKIHYLREQQCSVLFFKPSVINSKFELDVFNYTDVLSATETQDLAYLMQFHAGCDLAAKIIPLNGFDVSIIKHKYLQLHDQLEKQDNIFWPCRSRSYLFEILFSLYRQEDQCSAIIHAEMDPDFSKLTIDVIQYLHSNYSQKISIEKLSLLFHTNRTTLLADFKRSTGQSVNRYLIQLRMTMSAALLRDTTLNINEICERTGFHDISYFSKSFKKEIQYTPSDYRKINALQTFL